MKILFVALKHDTGKPERGLSVEYYNFYDTLAKMDNGRHKVLYFAFDEIMRESGHKAMNQKLLETVSSEKPDLCFFYLFRNEILPQTVKQITNMGIKTFNWFADDHWRFDNFSKYYAPNFSFVSTTDSEAPEKYRRIGYNNAIKTQWACNHFLYKPAGPVPPKDYTYGASFIGQVHGDRAKIMAELAEQGIDVSCFGAGWPNGRIDQTGMIEAFYKSRINLNLTKGSGYNSLRSVARVFLYKQHGRVRPHNPWRWAENCRSFLGHQRDQIKGRTFEVPGCGGFLLTGYADNLGEYYEDGREIIVFKDNAELARKIKYYLENPREREAIARCGYERTLREHTFEIRFREIFNIIFDI